MNELRRVTQCLAAGILVTVSFLLFAIQCPAQTFTNPLMTGADPWIVYDSGVYYSTATYMNACTTAVICVRSATTLTGLANAPWVGLWNPPAHGQPNCCDVWAPELHKINGVWYIYYAASDCTEGVDPGCNGSHHRLFVLQANSSDPLGSYSMGNTGLPNGQLADSTGGVGIDPDVFTATNGSLYLTWSCGYSGLASTCVAPMSDALHVSGTTALISQPTLTWETRHGTPTQEGQVGFTHSGHTYIMYSASPYYVWDSYCVGLLVNTNGNILDPNSWTKVGPIFDRHGTAGDVASFVFAPSPDGTETWTFYQGVDGTCSPDTCRNTRMQKVYWASDGTPIAGYPFNSGVAIPVPSGEQGYVGTGSTLRNWGNAYGDAAEGDTVDGKVVGSWTSPNANTTSSTSLGAGWHQNFSGRNPNFENYTLTAGLQWVQTGTTSAYPKYGLYASYEDVNNYATFWIDLKYGVVTSYAVVAGASQGWANCSLPGGFSPSSVNTLRVQKLGSIFNIWLNGTTVTGACAGRNFNLLNGQVGVVTEDTLANYTNFSVVTPAYQINSGGLAVAPFSADTYFNSGTTASTTSTISTSGVTNPAPMAVYQTERWGANSYTFPNLTPGATYTVRLHFAEFVWTTTGQRIFNVAINGTTVLSNFDIIAAAGGPNIAVVQQFRVAADNTGKITVAYTNGSADDPKSSGIEILD